ncbi:MAG: hypothetical protein ACREMT_01500, partial [Vulcanimicrobiaceae bacterium]
EGTLYGLRIGTTPVPYASARFSPTSRDPFDFNVGNGVLDRFVATFDYAGGTLTLDPPHRCATLR